MFLDKSLKTALVISLVFHALIFLPLPYFSQFKTKPDLPPLKITYVTPKAIIARPAQAAQTPAVVKPIPQKADQPLKVKEEKAAAPAPQAVKTAPALAKPAVSEPKIEIPPELPKAKEGLYLDYYQTIREKIRGAVLENYPRFIARGEVCLYFILSPDGKLKEINVIEERSSANRSLKEISLRSLRQSAPFIPFPKGLNQPELSFNVIISFELEN